MYEHEFFKQSKTRLFLFQDRKPKHVSFSEKVQERQLLQRPNKRLTMGESEEKPATQPTELEQKIIRQIEYYFGDRNLLRDKFLQEKINEDGGWVSLECLITFNRLKALSSDFDVILNALKKSDSGLLELDEEKKRIKRDAGKPLPDRLDPVMLKSAKEKTIYAKGFPTDYTMDKIEEFFAGKGKTVFIKMRREREEEHAFKGSVFVEFETAEMAQNFLEMKDLKIGETELEKMSREDFYKQQDIEKKAMKTSSKPKEEAEQYKKGCVLHFKGAGEGTSREDLRELFGEQEEIAWVDFVRNDTEGKIRFKNEGGAQKAIDAVKKANDGKIVIKEVESEVRVLEGDEENEFWKQAAKETLALQRQKRAQRGRGKKNGWGGPKRAWKHGNSDKPVAVSTENAKHERFDGDEQTKPSDEPKAKLAKVE